MEVLRNRLGGCHFTSWVVLLGVVLYDPVPKVIERRGLPYCAQWIIGGGRLYNNQSTRRNRETFCKMCSGHGVWKQIILFSECIPNMPSKGVSTLELAIRV